MARTGIRNLVKAILVAAGSLVLASCATVNAPLGANIAPDFYTVTATANYRPVNVPGTQRRVAQGDAELQARRQIYEYVGAMPVGNETVNDVIARDSRLRAEVLEAVRTAEVVDWTVDQACGRVQVWVRIDMNRIRQILAHCG